MDFLQTFLYKENDVNLFVIILITGVFIFIGKMLYFTVEMLTIKDNNKIILLNKNKIMRKK